jgi:hypothetical protein
MQQTEFGLRGSLEALVTAPSGPPEGPARDLTGESQNYQEVHDGWRGSGT